MRFLIIFILFISCSAYSDELSYSDLPAHQKEKLQQAKPAVWRLRAYTFRDGNFLNFSRGTAFFISPNRIITNWHVISSQFMSGKDIRSLSIWQEGSYRRLSVKKLVSISVLHDLALLEVEEESPSYLVLRETAVSDEEEFFMLGYPDGKFRYTLKTSSLKDIDNVYSSFYVKRANLSGNSGGPVLDVNNKVIGVVSASSILGEVSIIKGSVLRDFISGNIGLSIENQTDLDVINEEIEILKELIKNGLFKYKTIYRSKLAELALLERMVESNELSDFKWFRHLAEQGPAETQYLLGMIFYRGKDIERNFFLAFEWFFRSAKQGYAPAQYYLGRMFYQGRGIEQSFLLAFSWFRLAANQGHAVAQYLLLERDYFIKKLLEQSAFSEVDRLNPSIYPDYTEVESSQASS